jgi:NAD(P)-dependent dehydrogenase (short-subunit alcohol dehydrogenase family)
MRVAGKTALITGATSGSGRASVEAFARLRPAIKVSSRARSSAVNVTTYFSLLTDPLIRSPLCQRSEDIRSSYDPTRRS